MTASPSSPPGARDPLDDVLRPFRVDVDTCNALARRFVDSFAHLAAHSSEQFLPTPISQSILRPVTDHGHGR